MVALAEAWFISQPGTMDACYYAEGGREVALGRGTEENFLWNYLDFPPDIPHASFSYWMPLPSLVAALGYLLPPGDFREGQLPYLFLAALFPVFVAWLAKRFDQPHRISMFAGLIAAFSGFYTVYWLNIETFLLYAWIGGLFFLGVSLLREKRIVTATILLGVTCGLAHLTRADGPLLLLLAVLYGIFTGDLSFRKRFLGLLLMGAGYFLVTGPWYGRNIAAFGSLFPPGNSHSLWLIDYNDLFHFPPTELTPARFWADGWNALLSTRWEALRWNAQTLIFVMGFVFLAPFQWAGLLRLRHHPVFRMTMIYIGMLFLVMTVFFPLQGSRGGFFHSSSAVLSVLAIAAAEGLDLAVGKVGQWRNWDPELSIRILGSGMMLFCMLASAWIFTTRVVGGKPSNPIWAQSEEYEKHVLPYLDPTAKNSPRVMLNNSPCFTYQTGLESIPLPDDSMENVLQAAQYYRAGYLLLDGNSPTAMQPIYRGTRDDPRLEELTSWQTDLGRYVLFAIREEP
jgi:hypothetical protein